jgi:hypothetical protein
VAFLRKPAIIPEVFNLEDQLPAGLTNVEPESFRRAAVLVTGARSLAGPS